MSDSLRPHGLQHARPPCPSLTPRVYPNSRPLSRWCHPTISSSVISFSSSLKSFLASRSFQMIQFFASGGQIIGVSASTSVLPINTQDLFPLGWTGWISLQSKGLATVFSNTQFKNINSLELSFLYSPTLTSIHDHWKNHSLDYSDSWGRKESDRTDRLIWSDLIWKSLQMVTAAMTLKTLLGRKVMTNLDSMFKSRDITLPTKVHPIKAKVFPVVMYRCESWTIKKAELQRIDAFELWCWKDFWESLGLQEDQTS